MFRLWIATVTLALALGVAPALAGKGGNHSSSTTAGIALNESDPHYGDTVSFAVTYPSVRWDPLVRVLCYQNGALVYQYSQAPNGSTPWVPSFRLWDASWAANGGGSASCVADLYYYTWKGQTETSVVYLAHTDFTAAG